MAPGPSRLDPDADPWAGVPENHRSRHTRRRSAIGALFVAAVVISGAAWLTNSISLQQIAEEGAVGAHAGAARAAAIEARSNVVEAVSAAGPATSEELAELGAAVDSARAALSTLQIETSAMAPGLDADEVVLVAQADVLIAHLRAVLAALEQGSEDVPELMRRADRSFDVLVAGLALVADEALADVAMAADAAGQAEVASRVFVLIVVPLVLVALYRLAAGRAAKRRQLALALEHERGMVRAKDELIANISHELRTPLTGIVGFAQMAALDTELSAGELRKMAGMIATESEELARMVDDLITTARDREDALALAIEDVDPNQELAVVGVPVVIAGRDMAVDLHPGPLRADRLRLRQILRNLISNALKYGGPTVRLHGEAVDGRYLLSVIDDGRGIPAELETRLFTRFVHQGDTPLMTGSVGLGLSIAHRLAEIMGGTLTHRRIANETVFTLSLPLAESASVHTTEVA